MPAAVLPVLYDFVRRGIDAQNPLALLILRHRAPELKEDNWHWVTVSGYLDGADGIPASDVLALWMEDGSQAQIRPSGTEPKIKVYTERVTG